MRKFLSILTATVLALSLAPAVVAENSVWSGNSDTAWYNTTDTEFTLNTAEELAGFAELVNGGNTFKNKTVNLGADIDLGNAEWAPIGNSTAFLGQFNGNGYTVSNISVTGEGNNLGFFGFVGQPDGSTAVKNLTLKNVSIVGGNSSRYVGALIGNSFVSTITNCHVTGTIYVNGQRWVGGLIGGGYFTATDCSVSASEMAENGNIRAYYQVGGIVGMGNSATVTHCSVENIKIVSRVGGYVGSISGQVAEGGKIAENSVSNTTILSANNYQTVAGLYVGNVVAGYTQYIINNDSENLNASFANGDVIDTLVGESAASESGVQAVVGTNVVLDTSNKVVSGDFEITPPAAALVPDAELTTDSEGNITVSAAVASLGDPANEQNHYNSVSEAVNAASSGDTVYLLRAISTDIEIAGSITLDFNGNSFTGKIKPAADISLSFGATESDVSKARVLAPAKKGYIFDGFISNGTAVAETDGGYEIVLGATYEQSWIKDPNAPVKQNGVSGYIYINEHYHAMLVGGRFIAMPHEDNNTGFCYICRADLMPEIAE